MDKEKQYYEKLGAQLTTLRTLKGLSVEEVAEKLNLSSQELKSIENGEIEVGVEKVIALASFYNTSISEFVHFNTSLNADESESQYSSRNMQEIIAMMSLNFEHQKALLLKEIELLRSKLKP
ncbi:MAG TPA: helix-turn-helix transcriptional regulator [Bacteroidia bacterium]